MIAGAVGFIIYGWFVLVPPFYGNTSPFNFLEEWFGKTIDDFLSVWNRIILQVTGFFAVAGVLGDHRLDWLHAGYDSFTCFIGGFG